MNRNYGSDPIYESTWAYTIQWKLMMEGTGNTAQDMHNLIDNILDKYPSRPLKYSFRGKKVL